MESCVDRLLERLEDGSIKVVQHALASLERLQAALPTVFTHSPATSVALVAALLGASASAQKTVDAAGVAQLGAYLRRPDVSPQAYVPQLCGIAAHDKDRHRAVAFRVLADLLQGGPLDAHDALVSRAPPSQPPSAFLLFRCVPLCQIPHCACLLACLCGWLVGLWCR